MRGGEAWGAVAYSSIHTINIWIEEGKKRRLQCHIPSANNPFFKGTFLLGESEAGEKSVDAPLFLQGVLAILLHATG
jgi:hypothetical protein